MYVQNYVTALWSAFTYCLLNLKFLNLTEHRVSPERGDYHLHTELKIILIGPEQHSELFVFLVFAKSSQ